MFPNGVKKILWDVDHKTINRRKHKDFLIARIAEKGSWKDIIWLKNYYSLNSIKKTVAKSKNTSAKVKNFWKTI